MKSTLMAMVVLAILFTGGLLAFIYSGIYNIAASEEHFPPGSMGS